MPQTGPQGLFECRYLQQKRSWWGKCDGHHQATGIAIVIMRGAIVRQAGGEAERDFRYPVRVGKPGRICPRGCYAGESKQGADKRDQDDPQHSGTG